MYPFCDGDRKRAAHGAAGGMDKVRGGLRRNPFFQPLQGAREGRKLAAKKKRLYGEYQKARRDMQEVLTIKANIDCLLGYSEPAKKKEMER